MTEQFAIRAFHPIDMVALYKICLMTGNEGENATGTIDDDILGHYYAAPYARFAPDLCFILTRNGAACGYILGTADSTRFAQQCEQSWWPRLREKYLIREDMKPSRECSLIQSIHQGYQAPELAKQYPAHLHIDLLPEGQGKGFGRQLINRFCDALREQSVPALHLGVSRANKGAMAFYPRCGFQLIETSDDGVTFGKAL